MQRTGPETLRADDTLRGLERFGLERADLPPARLAAFDETRAFENFHVLRSAGEAHRKGFTQFADRFVAEREAGKHSPAGRISQRPERRVEFIFNHLVNYRTTSGDCQPPG